jgi:drug/metabolite transporter (DMT)-like permease
VSFRKLTTLAGVVLFGAFGDAALKHGMASLPPVPLERWWELVTVIFTPWVALGVLLLVAFFAAYLAALSFADLTYVLPATSVGYIVVALLARFFLHEQISLLRWLGIVLIVAGVGFVAGGPAHTTRKSDAEERVPESVSVGGRS